jgi:hypothetical protein
VFASLLGAAAIGGALTISADSYRPVFAVLAVGALVLLALALVRPFTSLIPWPLVILAAAYAWKLGDGEVDPWAPVYAAGVLSVAELAYWSTELRGRAHDAERLTERRAGLIATLALIAVIAGALVFAATSLRIGTGVALDVVGVVAAVGAVAVVAALARTERSRNQI